MKSIGLIGGMSWESTGAYYTKLNRAIAAQLGGLHSAPIWLHSVDFAPIEALQRAHQWDKAGELLAHSAYSLEQAGAEGIALCTNTMHKIAPRVAAKLHVPFIHIAHASGEALHTQGIEEILLLGTRFTMQESFYAKILAQYGITVHFPSQQEELDRIIFQELCLGRFLPRSRAVYEAEILAHLEQHPHTKGVLLACTEIGLLLEEDTLPVPLFDTLDLHVKAIVAFMLAD
jgi:aspartate racemase